MPEPLPLLVKAKTETQADRARQASRTRAADRKAYGRAKISNDVELLPDVDGRTLIARRYRDIVAAILVDQGGEERCSESRKQLVRRFAAAACIAEQMEAQLANGAEIDINEHALLVSTMVRVSNKIGVDRIAKDVTTLDQYLAQRRANGSATAEAVE
jgi:hypothetical protein